MPVLTLSGRALRALGKVDPSPYVARLVASVEESTDRAREILLGPPSPEAKGFRAYFVTSPTGAAENTFLLGASHRYLQGGDVVRVAPARGGLTALHRRGTFSNAMLVTEQCDNLCVMCSQPPKAGADGWLVDDLLEAIPLVAKDAGEIGITGGEPALLGPRLVQLLETLRDHLPSTAVHVLSNGRRFGTTNLAEAVASVEHPDLMIGIPLYGDVPAGHDHVVQAKGAFDETIRGILALKRRGVRVEIRCVISALTAPRLGDIARFVARNLTFVDHVALMGLERMGLARSNHALVAIDVGDYAPALVEATRVLARARMHVSIYNHQLCTLPTELHPYARQSIADWKNIYLEKCDDCALRPSCGGFFASVV